MNLGDGVLFYHSNADPSCVVGTATITRTSYPDHTAWDIHSPYFDPKSDRNNPRWFMVDVALESIFQIPLSLADLRKIPDLSKMELLRKGSRLSVQPVSSEAFQKIISLGKPQRVSK